MAKPIPPVLPGPPTIQHPVAPTAPIPPTKPALVFTTCVSDSTEIAKLPRKSVELAWPNERAKLNQLTQNAHKWFLSAPRPTQGNSVVPYVYGRCAFEDIADALATAISADHRIYLTGWWVEPWAKLKNPLEGFPPINALLQDYLRSTKAQIRALFWDNPRKKTPGDNEAITTFINSLPHGAAIEDAKLPQGDPPIRGPAGHHMKLLAISGRYGLVAFFGGMDINNSRVDVGGYNPLHDVHVRVTGPAAASCLAVFRDRWLDHPNTPALDKAKFQMSISAVEKDFERTSNQGYQALDSVTAPQGKTRTSNQLVAIGKTYAKLSKFSKGDSYRFAKDGDQSAWQLVKNGIINAKQWIYVEDQYLVSRRARVELLKKVKDPEFQFLLVLMGNSNHFEYDSNNIEKNEFPYLISARNEFRTDLMAIDPNRKKWRLFSLKPTNDPKRRQWCGDFVHSKVWVFDDDFVAVGSANCDDRGYTYDTEIMAGITEEPLERAAGSRFARELRVALWHKHLGVPHSLLQDFSKGLIHWLKPAPSSMIYDASDLEISPLLGSSLIRDDPTVDFAWTHLIDPDSDKL